MKCGNCHRDDADVTVKHVRECYGVVELNGEEQEMELVDPKAADFVPITEPQYNYINNLRIERGEQPNLDGYEKASETLTKNWAKVEIKRLQALPKTGKVSEMDLRIKAIPEGRFGIDSLTGTNDLAFYKVDKPTKGTWAGYTFVSQMVGGDQQLPIKGARKYDVLKAIAETGWEVAAMVYAHEMGCCWECGLSLTKVASRQIGMGYTCAERRGQGAEWLEIQRQWDADQKAKAEVKADPEMTHGPWLDADPSRTAPKGTPSRELSDKEEDLENATWK
jgi:hypothetical protein